MIKKMVTITVLAMLLGSPASYAEYNEKQLQALENVAKYKDVSPYVLVDKLKGACDDYDESFNKGVCNGYIVALADATHWNNESDYNRTMSACGEGLNNYGKLISLVEKYIDRHPEMSDFPAYQIITNAFQKDTLCPD
jgi:hypothetical protein